MREDILFDWKSIVKSISCNPMKLFRCVDWSRGVAPLLSDTSALDLTGLDLLLVPEDAVFTEL